MDTEESRYAADGVFASDTGLGVYLDEVYPILVDRFEREFPDAQLQCYEAERAL